MALDWTMTAFASGTCASWLRPGLQQENVGRSVAFLSPQPHLKWYYETHLIWVPTLKQESIDPVSGHLIQTTAQFFKRIGFVALVSGRL